MLPLFVYSFFSSITLAQFDNGIFVSDTQNYLPHNVIIYHIIGFLIWLLVLLFFFYIVVCFASELKLFVMINDLRQYNKD